MSVRMIPGFILVGLLAVACAVPIGAQLPIRQSSSSSSSPAAIDKPMTGKLVGTWYRQCERGIVAITFAEDELKICVTFNAASNTICLTLTANYAVMKDGLVEGAITGVNWDVKPEPKAATLSLALEALASAGLSFATLLDCPFSFQTQSTSTGLMVSNLKTTVAEEDESSRHVFFTLVDGIYTFSKDGTIPTSKSIEPAEYPLVFKDGPKKGKEVVVALFISSAPEIGPVFAGSEGKLTSGIAKKLLELAKDSKQKLVALDPVLVDKFKLNNPNWKQMHPSEWGKKLYVDFILKIRLDKMSLYQPGSLNMYYEGRADVTVDVYDVDAGAGEPKYNYVHPFKYPHTGILPTDSIPVSRFKQDYLEHLAAELATKHIKHKHGSGAGKDCEDQKQKSSVNFVTDVATFIVRLCGYDSTQAKFIQKSPDTGIVSIPENSNIFPTYYYEAAKNLIVKHVGPNYLIVDEREVRIDGSMGTKEYRITYQKKPIQPDSTPIGGRRE